MLKSWDCWCNHSFTKPVCIDRSARGRSYKKLTNNPCLLAFLATGDRARPNLPLSSPISQRKQPEREIGQRVPRLVIDRLLLPGFCPVLDAKSRDGQLYAELPPARNRPGRLLHEGLPSLRSCTAARTSFGDWLLPTEAVKCSGPREGRNCLLPDGEEEPSGVPRLKTAGCLRRGSTRKTEGQREADKAAVFQNPKNTVSQ